MGELTTTDRPSRNGRRETGFSTFTATCKRQLGSQATFDAFVRVFLNVAMRSLGQEEAAAELRRLADWLDKHDTRKPPN